MLISPAEARIYPSKNYGFSTCEPGNLGFNQQQKHVIPTTIWMELSRIHYTGILPTNVGIERSTIFNSNGA